MNRGTRFIRLFNKNEAIWFLNLHLFIYTKVKRNWLVFIVLVF